MPNVQFVIARAPNLASSLFALAGRSSNGVAIVEGRADDVLNASDVVVTASGTATVQTALHQRPMVIVYRLSPLTYRLGRRFVKLDTFGMVNLCRGRRIVPELMQDDFTPERVARGSTIAPDRPRPRRCHARRPARHAIPARRRRCKPSRRGRRAGGCARSRTAGPRPAQGRRNFREATSSSIADGWNADRRAGSASCRR